MSYSRTFYADLSKTTEASADVLLPLVLQFVQPKSVIDVGCGPGRWLAWLHRHGASDILGVDGPWVDPDLLQIPRDRFRIADLSQPLPLNQRYDLAVTLEVAEHLPADAATTFVESLTSAAPVVLFSAAIPCQGGTNHLNEQWPAYWSKLFAARGYQAYDCLRPAVWTDSTIEWWYAQNVLLFAEPQAETPALRPYRLTADPLPLVHPRLFALREAEFNRQLAPKGLRKVLSGVKSRVLRR